MYAKNKHIDGQKRWHNDAVAMMMTPFALNILSYGNAVPVFLCVVAYVAAIS